MSDKSISYVACVLLLCCMPALVWLGDYSGYNRATREAKEREALPHGEYNILPGSSVAILCVEDELPPMLVKSINLRYGCRDCHEGH
jgi:hypothetical protein